MNVPAETMVRVKTWCEFTWNTQKSFDEREILKYEFRELTKQSKLDILLVLLSDKSARYLPGKMMTDVALNIHFKVGTKTFAEIS